ncbi:MAG: tetratricopeptide repeat protein, partial [Nitrospirae bacterium]|nr:tetratricopeptide repeat protein [Nitrospirota bacterium]
EYKVYLSEYKNDTNVLLKLGMIFEQTGDYKSAVAKYENILEINPNSVVPLNNLAWNYAERDIDLDKALGYAMKAIELGKDNYNTLDTLGWIYFKRGDYKKALEYIKKAEELNKKHPTIYYHLASAYYKDGQKNEAVDALKTSLSLSDNFPEALDAKRLLQELQN